MSTRETYGDWLRALDDEQLRALLAARPELMTPVPADFAALANRAATPAAVSRALDRLDRLCLAVLETLLVLPAPASFAALVEALRDGLPAGAASRRSSDETVSGNVLPDAAADEPVSDRERRLGGGAVGEGAKGTHTESGTRDLAPELRAAVDRLRSLALIWGPEEALLVAPGVHAMLPHPAGLGPPIRTALEAMPAERRAALAADLRVRLSNGAGRGGARPGAARPGGTGGDDARPEAVAPRRAGTADATPARAPTDATGAPSATDPDDGVAGSGDPTVAALASHLSDPGTLDRLIREAGPDAGAALRKLAWGPPVGRVDDARRPVRLDTATSPVEQLLARGLLAATKESTVVLPREVALHLRGGRLFRDFSPAPPPLTGPTRDTALIDRTAGGQALTAVRLVEELLERWGVDPPAALRTGGLGVRDLRATAAALDVEEWAAVLLAECAFVAGLLARTENGGAWLPTKAYDLWRLRSTEQRWYDLVSRWVETDRVPGLAGQRDAKDRLINALSPDAIRASAPQVRRAALRALAAAPAGTAPDADTVHAYLQWREPRRGGPARRQLLGWSLREAELLGVTGLGALSTHGRALLAATDPGERADGRAEGRAEDGAGRVDPVAALAAVLPEPVDKIHLQADLTAIAPGPLVADMARELSLVADVESTGGATVYRFTPESVRRALDAGRGAADLHELLERLASTEVPQPLRYLIDDVARRHGRLRVGTASAYVRCDDPATLDEILAHRESGSLRLFRLAPTVLASRTPRAELLAGLRAMGYAPAAEALDGALVVVRPDARRADPVAPVHPAGPPPPPGASGVAAAVRALRAGEEAVRLAAPDGEPPQTPAVATIDRLRTAVDKGGRVWIGYLDQQGHASSRIVEPARVEGGYLTAYDATRAAIQRFALHRITGVAELDETR